jgi:serine/threonine protein kinase
MSPEYNGKSLMVERCGTGGYIAPEVGAKNSIVGPEIDMWAFGVMLYEFCTAYKPNKLCNYRYGKLNFIGLSISYLFTILYKFL